MACGCPSMKSAQPLKLFEAAPPLRDVIPPVNVKPPRAPYLSCGWKWLMPYLTKSNPKRKECRDRTQLAFPCTVYWLSRNTNGFDTLGLPKLVQPLTLKNG